MTRYAVVLDACVLVPIVLADTLLRVAERELYRPLWSSRITTEAIDAIARIHPHISEKQIAKRFDEMDKTFEDARVQNWKNLEKAVVLPDPNDRHVVAVAMRGRADAIVTRNIRDFPVDVLEPLGIDVIHPDNFLLDQFDLNPRIILTVIREQANSTQMPHLSPVDLIARLSKAGVPQFSDEIGRFI